MPIGMFEFVQFPALDVVANPAPAHLGKDNNDSGVQACIECFVHA